jgi:signal transduction histidine kinase
MLEDYGLIYTLRWYGEQFASRTGVAVTMQGEEPIPRLAAQVENMFFRITQEALTNVTKHARASQVTITVTTDDQNARLVIADDGVGFDRTQLEAPSESQGWGLPTMTERAEAIGAHCRIESCPQQGTQVIVEVAR